MGTLETSSLMHGASGKAGNLIFYTVNGKTYFRLCPGHYSDPRSAKQLLQRQRLICAQTLFQSVKKCLLYDALNIAAKQQKRRSGYHLFLKLNTNAFGSDDSIDYSLLSFCRGNLQLPFNFRLTGSNNRQAEFVWNNHDEQTTARESDRLIAAAVLPDEPYRVVLLPEVSALRRDEYAAVPLNGDIRRDVHLYCFFARQDLQSFSDDRYFYIKR